ncbi:MAG TPA: hypothetical protein VN512_06410 [Clostridia bacterium]|nr:hypothetical protein [Clostridia bacterium]
MSMEEGATVCDGMTMAYNYISKIDFSGEARILIYGASGSIGTAAVQLAKYYGTKVTAVYPLDEIVEATRYVETGLKIGNVVIRIAGISN